MRDAATGRAGAVTQRLIVPALDRPYLPTPILTDRIETPRGDLEEGDYVPTLEVVDKPTGRSLVTREAFVLKREAAPRSN